MYTYFFLEWLKRLDIGWKEWHRGKGSFNMILNIMIDNNIIAFQIKFVSTCASSCSRTLVLFILNEPPLREGYICEVDQCWRPWVKYLKKIRQPGSKHIEREVITFGFEALPRTRQFWHDCQFSLTKIYIFFIVNIFAYFIYVHTNIFGCLRISTTYSWIGNYCPLDFWTL